MYFLCQIFRIHKLICSPFSWVLSGEKIYRYMVNQIFELKFHCRMYLFYMDVSENKRFSSSFSASSRKIFFYDLKFCFFQQNLLMTTCFSFAFNYITKYEQQSIGLQWDNVCIIKNIFFALFFINYSLLCNILNITDAYFANWGWYFQLFLLLSVPIIWCNALHWNWSASFIL